MKTARVIDYETTGTPDDDNAEIIEVGFYDVDLDTREITNKFQTVIRPRGEIPPVTMAIHHLTIDDVKDGPEAREIMNIILEGADVFVAHNAKFEQHFTPDTKTPWICTYKVARVVWPDAPGHGNQVIRYWLDLDIDSEKASPPHRALPDAYVTAAIFARLLDEKTVEEMIHISKYPALLKVMNFGKHKGTTFADAPLDYLDWIVSKSDMDEDTKFTAKYWVRKRL